jgi:type IV pilus assembly protein PilA
VHRRDDGFTLIELLLVIMIVAVLMLIAIPSFLGFRSKSQDRAAQASLITAEKITYFVILEEGQLPGRAELLARLPIIESAIIWIDHFDDSTDPREVSLDETAGGQQLALAAYSHSGSCFYLRVINGAPPAKKVVTSAATCQAHDFQVGADTGW